MKKEYREIEVQSAIIGWEGVGTSVIFSGNLVFQVSENCQNFDQFIVTLNRLLDYLLTKI
ncbi:hypothetical protein DB317_07390 [Vibrio cholerae]|nr:hypothetical protein DB317_07390 [Vibrio cholerae]